MINCFIGHNFGDYKNHCSASSTCLNVLSVTILETTKTARHFVYLEAMFYRSQFWRLQKLKRISVIQITSFIGHNFGDYKNYQKNLHFPHSVLSVTILETTKTGWKYQ